MPPKGERRKQQIIDTAKEMFIEKGFQSTHIGQVCEKLNIARGTVYQYFSNKKEILYAILTSVVDKIDDIMDPDDLQDFMSSGNDRSLVIKLINKRISDSISVLLGEPIVIKLIFKEVVGIDMDVINTVNRYVGQIEKIIAREISEIKKLGMFRQDVDPDITSSMIIGAVMVIVYEYDRRKDDVTAPTVVEKITDNYLNGILA